MMYVRFLFMLLAVGSAGYGQTFESFYVNLYTDSLKKGTFNYINIEGITTEGNVLPLDTNHVVFKATSGKFFGNSLWLDSSCNEESVTVTATLKGKIPKSETVVIFIKRNQDNEALPSEEEIIKKAGKNRK